MDTDCDEFETEIETSGKIMLVVSYRKNASTDLSTVSMHFHRQETNT